MKIVSITTMIPTRSGFAWWPCELIDVPPGTPDDVAVKAAYDLLIRDGLLRVIKLDLEPMDGRQKAIRGRMPTIMGKGIIGTITPLHIEIAEVA